MMIFRSIHASCPRCQYSVEVREDSVPQYEARCPSCGYTVGTNDEGWYAGGDLGIGPVRGRTRTRKTKDKLEREEWLMDI